MSNEVVDQGKENLRGGLGALFQKIGKGIEDAASLEVATFAGSFEYKVSDIVRNDVDKVQIENVLKSLTVHNQTNLQLVAFTSVKIDSDVSTIVKKDLSEADAELLKLHKEMIVSGKESRQAVIKLVTDILNITK